MQLNEQLCVLDDEVYFLQYPKININESYKIEKENDNSLLLNYNRKINVILK